MSKSQQRKGRGGELEICRILQAHGIPAEPGQAEIGRASWRERV